MRLSEPEADPEGKGGNYFSSPWKSLPALPTGRQAVGRGGLEGF